MKEESLKEAPWVESSKFEEEAGMSHWLFWMSLLLKVEEVVFFDHLSASSQRV